MRKFGSFQVLAAARGAIPDLPGTAMQKSAYRAVFDFVPREGFIYVRSRAISSRCNDNWDYFGPEDIAKSYKSFEGKPVFVNHVNDNHKHARGLVLQAALHRDFNPDGSPDTWAEVLMEIDGKSYPKLAKALLDGDIDRTSMGCDVQISKCSFCGNEARNPLEYCQHIPGKKGQRIYRQMPDGRREGVLVYEICSGLHFFENSLLVEPPADPTAFFLGNIEVGPGLDHIVAQTKRKTARIEELIAGEQRQLGYLLKPAVSAMSVTASRRVTASDFLDKYPSDDEIDRKREGGFGGGEPWVPYKHQLESRPEPRVAYPAHVAQDGPSSRETGTKYKRVPPGHPGAFPTSSPSDEYHGPYEVIQHPETGKYHVVDNQDRLSGYGGRNGIDDRHQAEYSRDYAEHKQQSKEKARGIADKLWNGMHEIFDPGGTDESRESESRTRGMNNLLNLGYQPKDIQAEREDHDPYAEVHHPSGWSARDHGGVYIDLHHKATGDEAHDVINVSRNDSHGGRAPGYGPVELGQDLHHWVNEYGHDTENNDPRIQRWRNRRLSALTSTAASREPSKGEKFLTESPPSADHIVKRFLAASPEEHDAGMNWYSDAHHIAKAIGHGDTATAAGLMGVYSAGTPVAPNYHYASRALIHKIPVGGKTTPEGIDSDFHGRPNANQSQADQAQRMLNGEHHSAVLHSPKVSNYAHLIEHGDDEPGREGPGRVVVDRHAVSAAIDRRVTDNEFSDLGLSSDQTRKDGSNPYGDDKNAKYHHIANAYREATTRLQDMGHDVKPHQVQAVVWTVQKRYNDAEDEARSQVDSTARGRIRGRQKSMDSQRDAWQEHYKTMHDNQHMPENPRLHWGKLAYGETKSPPDVDTLRNEQCTICGNDSAYNGRECLVCGYMAPPKALGDPDVEKAKSLDDLKQSVDDELLEADPSRKGAPFDEGTMPGETDGDDSNSPWLECTNCATGFRPATPQTVGDEPQEAPAGPAEGDSCPVCQKGQLASTGQPEDDGEEEDPEAAEQDAEDEDEDETDDSPVGTGTKLPASKNTAAMKYRTSPKENPMQQALASLIEIQETQEALAHQNLVLQRRIATKDSQIQRLTAAVQTIVQHLGPELDTLVRQAMLQKHADEQNPAQPVPEPAPEPPTESSVEAETPEATADVRMPGMVPGTNQDVAADAVSTAYTPGQDIPSPGVNQLVDVTRPIDGTQGPRPLSEVRTNVDVRAGNPMNPQVAFPVGGPFAEAQRTGSTGDLRIMACLRLARLRIAAGLADGGGEGADLQLAQHIASDESLTMAQITHDIETLNQVSKASARRQQAAPPRGAVPRPAQVQRTVPVLTGASLQATAGYQGDEDAALAAVFLGDWGNDALSG